MKTDVLKTEIAELLRTSGAHADFDKAIRGFPLEDAGKRPKGVPYSAWQLLEHMRIAQADILEYVSTPDYAAKNWPQDYWPKTPAPPSEDAWAKTIRAIRRDRKRVIALLEQSDPLKPIKFASNKTLLREILLIVDHDAYHLGELVLLRRLLGNWK
ncbi:MAG TPA: DinB family protein [Bryobacteraceae bacterium]|nr:DinB family protein [Bryobacteraceae bacterium]